MTDYISINGSELVPATNIKKLTPIRAEERQSLSQLGDHVDASRFRTRVDFSDKSKSYVPETIEELAAGTSGLICIDDENSVFILADNITKAKNVTDRDRQSFETRTGRAMRADLVSRVESKAGVVLAAIPAEMVMKRMSQPVSGSVVLPETTEVAEPGEDSEPAITQSAAQAFEPG